MKRKSWQHAVGLLSRYQRRHGLRSSWDQEFGALALRMAQVALRYWRDGELTWFKIRQYGDLKQLISQ